MFGSCWDETFTVLLGGVAAISLLVGGIGVMNIMLVTVTERTREIGIRKAIGAPKSVILVQFLVESVLLSLIGGIAGVAVGIIGSQFRIVGVQPVIVPYSIALAFGVALAVGVFFGFYPANGRPPSGPSTPCGTNDPPGPAPAAVCRRWLLGWLGLAKAPRQVQWKHGRGGIAFRRLCRT